MIGTIVQNNSTSSEFEQAVIGIHKKPATIFITNSSVILHLLKYTLS